MKIYDFNKLSDVEIDQLCSRSLEDDQQVVSTVRDILDGVKSQGDALLRQLAERFDGVKLDLLYLGATELAALAADIPEAARKAIDTAAANIRRFHETQLRQEDRVETMPGVTCWRESRPIESVGLYVPGGSAVLPSTFLMLAIPAALAGCKQIVVCSPPQTDGKTNCYLAYCATLLGIDRLYLAGGAQAIAAMAYGTETIPAVSKIFGPGNRYVTAAKQLVQNRVAIDMPAGPSEVLIVADETANSAYLAADLLAQAEHGPDSQAVLVATSRDILEQTIAELDRQVISLPRRDIAAKALNNSYMIYADTLQSAMQFSNRYAPEHLILATEHFESLLTQISNAGSVFLGNLTPESAGDYASGTNHTLPTSGFAKGYSGVSVDSFLKKVTFQHISPRGLQNLGPTVEILASAEGLDAHRNAVSIRLEELQRTDQNS
ncbi:histidinol dehydrogenase [Pedobacter yulinensis]|uniref:Histidinol dehydrogenase n=1 Tax=Pedobacter yulinensis TaxID=2126353 RepID=A0A2T3HH73_9SPHI|nr:histidinol dehydrogenase [Pedobacter yulinensis]PST81789.1 histidinol dehydrogenase [Pedobacter yulinensis]